MGARGTVAPLTPGAVRLTIDTRTGRRLVVGPLSSLAGARRLAEDLIGDGTVTRVRVDHRNKGRWRPAWSWLAALAVVGVLLGGCAAMTNPGTRPTTNVEEARLNPLSAPLLQVARQSGMTCKLEWRVVRDGQEASSGVHLVAMRGSPGVLACLSPVWVLVTPQVLDTFTDADLQAALAHELAHAIHRDRFRENVSQLQKEREADALGAQLLARVSPEACWGMPRLMEKLSVIYGPDPDRDHPPLPERAATTAALCAASALQSGRTAGEVAVESTTVVCAAVGGCLPERTIQSPTQCDVATSAGRPCVEPTPCVAVQDTRSGSWRCQTPKAD